MKFKTILSSLILILNGVITSFSQGLENKIDEAFNKLYMDTTFILGRLKNDSTKEQAEHTYDFLYDSIENFVVKDYIQKEILPTQKFSWPSYAIRQNTYPSSTYSYLLLHHYNIGPAPSHGCIIPHYRNLYDTIMANEIRKKYGADFFERTYFEANILDSNNKGLILPHSNLKDSFISFVRKELPFIDTLKILYSQTPIYYIILNFKNGKLQEASLAEQFWGSFQTPLEMVTHSESVTKTFLKLKWVGPKFNNQPANKSVILDLRENRLYFDYEWY